MTTHAETKARPAAAAPLTKFTSALSQRKCACGGSAGLKTECGDCAKQRAGRPHNPETQPVSSETHTATDGLLRFAGRPRLGHNFSEVQVLGAAAVALEGDTPVEKGKANPKPKPADAKVEETPAPAPAPAPATTPDGTSLGPTNRAKKFCLKADTFKVQTAIHKNTASAAQASQIITFEGLNTGKQDTKDCSCDCGLYRHWISGFMQIITLDQVNNVRAVMIGERRKAGTPGIPTMQEALTRAIATTPKIYSLKSCNHPLAIQEGTFTEEHISCIGDNDPDRCKWKYGDGPGADSGLSDGIFIHVNLPFQYEIWDSCQGKSYQKKQATVEIKGDTSPRSITWT